MSRPRGRDTVVGKVNTGELSMFVNAMEFVLGTFMTVEEKDMARIHVTGENKSGFRIILMTFNYGGNRDAAMAQSQAVCDVLNFKGYN